MQLHQTLFIALFSFLLFACGSEKDSTDSDTTVKEESVVEEASPAEAGIPSYFTYTGPSQSFIAIQGTGGVGRAEASVLTFQLLDLNGDPVSGVAVNFSLQAPSGSTLEPLTGTTDSSGFVSTTVSSGKVSGSVRVTVTTADGEIELVSDILSVSTGLPDQNSISLSLENHAPEAWEYDGVQVAATALLADHFNNAVPDGTAVYFTTEGGAIRDSENAMGACLTVGGKCTLTWESQNPRPDGNQLNNEGVTNGCASFAFDQSGSGLNIGPCINSGGMGQPYAGRVTITAFAIGEESFIDNDADGWFTDGDTFLTATDLPEVFYDHNEDGFYKEDPSATGIGDAEEEFHDFAPIDQAYSPANGIYNGMLCSSESESLGQCSRDLVNVQANTVLIMASGTQYFRVQNTGVDTNSADLTTATGSASVTLQVYVADIYNNRPPTGTTISVTTDNGKLSGKTDWLLADGAYYGPFSFSITLTREGTANGKTSGFATITVTSPRGIPSTYDIAVSDDG